MALHRWILFGLFGLAAVGGVAWFLLNGPETKVSFDPSVADGGIDGGSPDQPADRVPAAEKNFNPGWIGSTCTHDGDCSFENGFCLMPEEGFPGGYCSSRCDKFCPDRQGDLYSPTFCIEDPTFGARGICAAQCNLHLTRSGCRPGYVCTTLRRIGEQTVRMVCLPDKGTPPPPTECTRKLDQSGVAYARPDLADTPSRPARPGDPPPDQEVCQIDTPVLLSSPLRGVDYRLKGQRHADHLLVACKFALALEKFSDILAGLDVVEVEHNGTYVCRGVAGTHSLSGHGHALAIDVIGFELAKDSPVSIEDHWNGRDKKKAKFLNDLVDALRKASTFDVVLTPASNRAHQDHLHLEIHAG